jgi:hypothetical protein
MRFSRYRQLSGANYNVSVTQILESEKKIKILELLKISSGKDQKFVLNNLNFCEEKFEFIDFFNDIEPFFDINQYINTFLLEKQELLVLVYISGYVANTISKKSCCKCRSLLHNDNNLNVDINENFDYLNIINRGGLKKPTEFLINICSTMYKVFKIVLLHFEEIFLSTGNHKKVLVNLIPRRCD